MIAARGNFVGLDLPTTQRQIAPRPPATTGGAGAGEAGQSGGAASGDGMQPPKVINTPSSVLMGFDVTPPTLKQEPITTQDDMTAFNKTIVGKLIGKAANVATVLTSPNPIMATAAALKGGVATAKKEEVNVAKDVQDTRKASQNAGNTTTEEKTGLQKPYTFLKMTFPIWVWGAAAVVILFLFYKFVLKRFMGGGARSGGVRRRSSGTSSARARMARVRSFRRKRK